MQLLTNLLSTWKLLDTLGGYRSTSSLNLHTANSGAGYTSPGQSQGRSLREYDEKLNALQKENFNLKLRLFFLEEKTTTGPSKGDDESLFKQNLDLKVCICLQFIDVNSALISFWSNQWIGREWRASQRITRQTRAAMSSGQGNGAYGRLTKKINGQEFCNYSRFDGKDPIPWGEHNFLQ